jgi:hypothetical protein
MQFDLWRGARVSFFCEGLPLQVKQGSLPLPKHGPAPCSRPRPSALSPTTHTNSRQPPCSSLALWHSIAGRRDPTRGRSPAHPAHGDPNKARPDWPNGDSCLSES